MTSVIIIPNGSMTGARDPRFPHEYTRLHLLDFLNDRGSGDMSDLLDTLPEGTALAQAVETDEDAWQLLCGLMEEQYAVTVVEVQR